MAIKNIIARGIGFSPGSVKWIPTGGFGSGAAPAAGDSAHIGWKATPGLVHYKAPRSAPEFKTTGRPEYKAH